MSRLPYDEAIERGEKYEKLLKDVLKFNEVTVHKDLSKIEVLKVLDSLEDQATHFEQNKSEKEVLSVAIINVGYYLDL